MPFLVWLGWLVLAIVNGVLGVLGILLPVIPQIPFLIIFLIACSKAFPRFGRWLNNTKPVKLLHRQAEKLVKKHRDKPGWWDKTVVYVCQLLLSI